MYADSDIQLALLTVPVPALTCQANAERGERERVSKEKKKNIREFEQYA